MKQKHYHMRKKCTAICSRLHTTPSHQKLAKSAHPLKEELTLCLMDLLQEGEVEVDADHSPEWVKTVDRGELKQ